MHIPITFRAGRYRLQLLPRQPYEAAYRPAEAVIGFAFESQAGVHAFAGEKKRTFQTRPNSLAFVPAGCEVYSQSREGGEYLTLTAFQARGEWRFNDVVDKQAIGAAEALRRLLLSAVPDPLIAENLALALEDRASYVLGEAAHEPRCAGWMTPRRMRIIEEMIDARLGGELTLEDLADAVGLSAGFFTRAFHARTGKPPHTYVIDRRVSRARALLISSDLGISAIAHACGFASHSNMTSVFRRRLGVTPTALRAKAGA